MRMIKRISLLVRGSIIEVPPMENLLPGKTHG